MSGTANVSIAHAIRSSLASQRLRAADVMDIVSITIEPPGAVRPDAI
jgi:hypothetical protein